MESLVEPSTVVAGAPSGEPATSEHGSAPVPESIPPQRVWWLWLVATALTLINGAVVYNLPDPGLDASWVQGLEIAREAGMHHGSEIVFAYGPLFWIESPTALSPMTILIAFVAAQVVTIALAWCLLRACWNHNKAVAVIATYVVLSTLVANVGLSERVFALCAALLLLNIRPGWIRIPPRIPPVAVAAAIGLATGAAMLIRISFVSVGVAAGVAFLGLPWRRLVTCTVALGSGLLVGLVGAWLVTGQRLGDLFPWLQQSKDLSTGYVDAMAIDQPIFPRVHDVVLLATVGLIVLAVMDILRSGTLRRRAIAVWAAVGVLYLFELRSGLIRNDGHVWRYLTFVAVVAVVAAGVREVRHLGQGLAVVMVACFALTSLTPWRSQLNPLANPAVSDHGIRTVVDTLSRTVNGERRAADIEGGIERIREDFAIPDSMIDQIGSGTVHMEPNDTAAILGYGFNWKPLPVFQQYSAFTPRLDDLNSEALINDGPDFILRREATIDGRPPTWDSPRTTVELACWYEVVQQEGGWQLFERRDESVCGKSRVVEEMELKPGELLPINCDGSTMETVRFDVELSLGEKLRRLFYRPTQLTQVVELGAVPPTLPDGSRRSRLVVATADQPHLLCVPDSFGWAPQFTDDFRGTSLAVLGAEKVTAKIEEIDVDDQ